MYNKDRITCLGLTVLMKGGEIFVREVTKKCCKTIKMTYIRVRYY